MSLEPSSTELVKAGAEGAAEGATRAFLTTLAGPAVELGAYVEDWIRFRRWTSQVRMLGLAQTFLRRRGQDPRRVPMKVLVPLLDAAGLEEPDDDDMLSRWAALLANAASDSAPDVIPAFPLVLEQLGALDAQIADRLSRDEIPIGTVSLPGLREPVLPHPYPDQGDIAAALSTESAELVELALANLVRLGILEIPLVGPEPLTEKLGFRAATQYVITPFGRAFVAACSATQ